MVLKRRLFLLSAEEVFVRLSNPIRHAFAAYYNNNNFKFPEHVVVFRDGVGDGQVTT